MTAVILVSLIGGGAALPYSLQHGRNQGSGKGAAPAGGGSSAVTDVTMKAVQWISQQVSRNAIVACDAPTCSALAARGAPQANLLVLRAASANPAAAGVVVVTPALRRQFGNRLTSTLVPSVIAGFGSGADRVTVQVTAPHGLAAYDRALRADVDARKKAGAQLLANTRIKLTADARRQLADGEVDSRILLLLPVLAATHPIQVLAFGGRGPGASPGVPLRSADLSGSGEVAGIAGGSYAKWLYSATRAQVSGFPASVTVRRDGSQPRMRVEFSPPSPLGLLQKR